MSFQSFDTSNSGGMGYPGGGWGGGGWFGGGAAGGAFLGGLAGGVVGDLLFDGRGGRGRGHGGWDGEGVVQINNNGRGHGRGDHIDDLFIMKELFDIHYNQATQTEKLMSQNFQFVLANNAQLCGIAKEIAFTSNATQKEILMAQFANQLQFAGLSREMAECCCKQLLQMTELNYQAQLREQANFGAVQKELGEIKCMIKNSELEEQIRYLTRENAEKDRKLNTMEIIEAVTCGPRKVEIKEDFVRPLTPQYIPFWPAVAEPRRNDDCRRDNFFNNNWGFQ